MVGVGITNAMIARSRENRHGSPWHLPERWTEDSADVRPSLDQIPIIRLAARRIAIVTCGQHKPCSARRDQRYLLRLIRIAPRAIHITPIPEYHKRIGLIRTGRDLRPEGGSRVGPEQVHFVCWTRTQINSIAVLCPRSQIEHRLPLILSHAVYRDRHM